MLEFRTTNAVVFLACVGLLATAYYMEYVMYLEPCPLCMVQRIAFVLVGLTCLSGFLHNPGRRGRISYSIVQLTFCVIGAASAGRHIWLQNAPVDKIPECFPGISTIFARNPLFDAVAIVFSGTGECAEISWTFLGLTIPEWAMVAFVCFACVAIYQLARIKRTHPKTT
ncbi:MAG: disulfide bond formation protein B [Gammaproteobacteria bacterium]|nr:disulfide bond formation protein B [Gammaproteobacteria bacterium]